MRQLTRVLTMAAMLALPSAAQAQLHLSPFAGVNFGGDTTTTSGTAGVSVNFMVNKTFGLEAEIAHTPSFFEQDGFLTQRSLTTLTGSIIAAVPIGSDKLRPFLVAGIGVLRPNLAEAGDVLGLDGKTTALSVGGGLMGFVNEHVGFRGDLRYLRGLKKSDLDNNVLGVDFSRFSFWRTTAGLVVRF